MVRKYEDKQLTVEYIKVFSEKMKQSIKVEDLEKYLKSRQYKDLADLGIPQIQS